MESVHLQFEPGFMGDEEEIRAPSGCSGLRAGQGLLEFYQPPTLREKLATRADAPLQPRRPQHR